MKVRLGDICDIRDGTHDSPKYVTKGYPLVTSKNIINGTLDLKVVNFISEKDYNKINERSKVDLGDIIMPMIGTIGNPYLVNQTPNYAIKNVALIKFVNDKILNKYVLYYLKSNSFKRAVDEMHRGGTQKFISLGNIRDLMIEIVSKDKQQIIVNKLNKIFKVIEYKNRQLMLLDNLIKSRFVELFVDKNFPEITIGELVASKVSSVKKVFLPTDTIKYIDISSIDNIRNIMTGFTEYVLEDAPSRAQQHIRKGDIVVSTVRPNLKNVAITGYDYDNLVASSGFCVLRAEKCLPSYLMAVICSDDFTDAMTKVVTGANYPAIKDSDVKNYVVPNPPIELQEKFAAFVEQTDKLKLSIQKSLDKTQKLFDSLMQEYFG